MLPLRLRRLLPAALVSSAISISCSHPVSVPVPATVAAPAPSPTTLLVRLGVDTIAMEQYTRTPTRMDGILIQRSPFTTISRYSVELGAGNVPSHAEYSLRRGDGNLIQGSVNQSLSVRYGADSVWFIAHRASGDTSRSMPARGQLLPYVNGSYALYELALARLRAAGRDSADFSIVPLNFGVRGTSSLPVKITGPDAARITWFGLPLYARYERDGALVGMDGSQTTVKVRIDRVGEVNLDTVARSWMAREQTIGVMGQVSTRDTVRATIGRAHVWVDYGRPSLRGRDVWVNGVLGDTIWRTGANAATQLVTDAPISIGGTQIPAGKYSLWTWTTGSGYRLIVNKQSGQWGTEYHAAQDLARIPLREAAASPPQERFTVGLDPQGSGALLTFTWGPKQLSVPITAR